jgi:hypothetical protein
MKNHNKFHKKITHKSVSISLKNQWIINRKSRDNHEKFNEKSVNIT